MNAVSALTRFDITASLPAFDPVPAADGDTVQIDLDTRSYPIRIGSGLLGQPETWAGLPKARQAVIVTNTTVQPLYAAQLEQALAPHYAQVRTVALPDGEQYKTWESLNQIFDALLGGQCDRKTVLFALGGGVVGDMTGFAAACYMRGVPFVQVPTTLLAQVDSSVGGKTAINHPLGKNMIGAFYQPRRVVCDMDTFATLPDRELSAGLAEVIKYGPIADMAFFEWLEQNMEKLRARDADALRVAVRRSCQIKAWVVGQDEQESGMRAILNYGHTFGHAIEAGLGFGTWLHGEAVGCGMVLATELSARLGLVDGAFVQRVRNLVQRAGLPVLAPQLEEDSPASASASASASNGNGNGNGANTEAWLHHMRVDKKAEAGQIRFVVIAQPGEAALATAPDALVAEVITAHSNPHACLMQR